MSFHTTHAHGDAHGPAASGGTTGSPGKHTQVEAVSQGAHAEAAGASAPSPSGVNLTTLQHFIAKHEGYVDHVYLDSRGFPTAGIGHLLTGSHLHVGQKVSAEQITAWFKQDVAKAIAGAKQDIGPAYDRLDEARKMVVIDMVFNLGSAGFGGFHATIHAIQTGAYAQAASNMLQSLWASQVGNRAKEDAAIMRSGHLGGGSAPDDHGHGEAPHGHGEAPHGTSHAPTIGEVRAGHGVLKTGEQGPAVEKIQHLLHVAADGIFGDQTLHAVEKFQRAHHLTADGIVGQKTLEALEHKAPGKPQGDHGHPDTGGVKAPDDGKHGDGKHGDGSRPAHGKWSPAPSLEAVKSGTATLHTGEKGPAVKSVQRLLAVDDDGEFGPATRAAVLGFEHDHHMKRHDGVIDAHTLSLLTKHPVGSLEGESRDGAAQRHKMLGVARAGSAGRRPDGRCYYHVCQFFIQCGGYGKIKNPYTQFTAADLPEAHDFADLMNSHGAARWGIERLSLSNPYDAPAGSIVVVAAGSPGTADPTAGDIAIADGHGSFFNGGMMSYSGRAGWNASPRAKLLGCYVPR
jgi:peptidoglycan hydrolase-like protein with peptidoglycan-binding domain